eukprot:COSAG06_NODE_500_length_14997_cov_8.492549_11_plen_45_part_00
MWMSERVKRGKRRHMLMVASACRVAVAAGGESMRAQCRWQIREA